MVQVVKQYAKRRVIGVQHRLVQGSAAAIAAVLEATGGGSVLNTAFIERLNATFRAALAPLVRRGRALVRMEATLEAGMYLVGCVYNFCDYHESLRQIAPGGSGRKWLERTPAMAAGLTGERWKVLGLLSYAIPPPMQVAKPRHKRRPKSVERQELPLAA